MSAEKGRKFIEVACRCCEAHESTIPPTVAPCAIFKAHIAAGSPTISSSIERFGYGRRSSRISVVEFVLREKKEELTLLCCYIAERSGNVVSLISVRYNNRLNGARRCSSSSSSCCCCLPDSRLRAAEEVCLNLLHKKAAATVFNGGIGRVIFRYHYYYYYE
ncbi:hypothetical protein LOAG_03807 [Loa loa]|uniref:Uncharacterized protein n=1 Tax=Loa loa TaxID=7209 RepID=A0A1S0U5J1_LOALO|nr:hypothetical protein LOAG_03807 [Loa loa]EFO24677.1 hypothetical protein LOAG_03807 [Loa loa]